MEINIAIPELERILQRTWGTVPAKISETDQGFVAKSLKIQTERNTYFAKVISIRSRYTANISQSLEALELIKNYGITNIAYPIKTIDEKLFYSDNNYLIILFDYVDGEWGFDYVKKSYLKLLKSVHDINPIKFKPIVKFEDFESNFLKELDANLTRVLKDNNIQDKLGRSSEYIHYVRKLISEFQVVSDSCKEIDTSSFVLTHGDAPGNIIKTKKNELFLIDWDDILLAPIERDLWFHSGDAEIKHIYPDYSLNTNCYKYYVMRRYLDDLSGYLEEIYNQNSTPESIKKNIDGIKDDVFEWLQPEVDKIFS